MVVVVAVVVVVVVVVAAAVVVVVVVGGWGCASFYHEINALMTAYCESVSVCMWVGSSDNIYVFSKASGCPRFTVYLFPFQIFGVEKIHN
jgi:hypothetical protein